MTRNARISRKGCQNRENFDKFCLFVWLCFFFWFVYLFICFAGEENRSDYHDFSYTLFDIMGDVMYGAGGGGAVETLRNA